MGMELVIVYVASMIIILIGLIKWVGEQEEDEDEQ